VQVIEELLLMESVVFKEVSLAGLILP